MTPSKPWEFVAYYAAALVIALLVFWRQRRRGMRLRFGRSRGTKAAEGRVHNAGEFLTGKKGPEIVGADKFSHINRSGERPLNVVFNYNGHSWDAYEVLGLPAGSSLEKVEAAYREGLNRVDAGSKPFIEAAHQAIVAQWASFRAAGGQ